VSEVFVSYQRENLAAVGRLVEALRAEGIGVWWDQDIPPNAAWEATIEHQLSLAKVVLVAWSPASVASENVKAEARWARQQGLLLQVFVEACEPPLFFGERQGVDLKHWSGVASDPAFRTVLEAVRKELRQPSPPSPDAAAAPDVFASEAAPPPLPSKPSIAVLPFTDMTGSEGQDYFADGMVVEIVEALSRIRSIFVIASGSGLSFKGRGVSAQEAARELGVRYVLEGSIRKAGGRVRIGVQLIDASDGAQIWTNRFEDTLEDVFALQDKVALAVAGKIEPAVQEAEVRHASARPTENVGSYDLYLRAMALSRSLDRIGMLQAIDLLKRAIALDPGFGLALSAMASCHYFIDIFGWSDDLERNRREGVEMAHRSVRAAGDDADVLATAARSAVHLERDLDGAVALVERAIALNPGCARAWVASGLVRTRAGETDLAVEHIETAMRLDPAGPNRSRQLLLLGVARFQQGRYSEVVALMREATQQIDSPTGYAFLAASYGHLGDLDAAAEALARYRTVSPRPVEEFGRSLLSSEASHQSRFHDGIALLEGKTPSDSAAGV
jgi:TolB-like protein